MKAVYSITNKKNGKIYIGSTINYKKRKSQHLTNLKGGYHENYRLQEGYDNYGEISFKFDVLLDANNMSDKERYSKEEEYINDCKSYEVGYNLSYDERGRHIITDDTRNKMSKNTLGKNNPFYGKTHTKETKELLSECAPKRTGEKNSFYGREHSKEALDKMKKSYDKLKETGWTNPQKGILKTKEHNYNNMIAQPHRIEIEVDGVRYSSVSECHRALNLHRHTITKRLDDDRFPNYIRIVQ